MFERAAAEAPLRLAAIIDHLIRLLPASTSRNGRAAHGRGSAEPQRDVAGRDRAQAGGRVDLQLALVVDARRHAARHFHALFEQHDFAPRIGVRRRATAGGTARKPSAEKRVRVASSALSMAASVSVRLAPGQRARQRRWRVARRRHRGRAALPVGFLDLRGEFSRAVQVDADADHDRAVVCGVFQAVSIRMPASLPSSSSTSFGHFSASLADADSGSVSRRRARRCRRRGSVRRALRSAAATRTRSKTAARCPVAQPTDARAGRGPPSARYATRTSGAIALAGDRSRGAFLHARHQVGIGGARFRRRSRLTSRAPAARRAS